MPAYRFFTDQVLKEKKEITLEGFEHKHIKQVMRLDVGNEIEVTDGKGNLALAKICVCEKSSTTVEITTLTFFPKEHDLILLQAMPKASKLDLILEKGVELGLTEIHIFMGEKSIQKLPLEKLGRLQTIATSALKQSARLYLPQIKVISPISKWPDAPSNAFFGDLGEGAPLLFNALGEIQGIKKLYFCNGPEAGFTKKELKLLRQKKFNGVSLHTNVLRTETAPLAFLSIAFQKFLTESDGSIVN